MGMRELHSEAIRKSNAGETPEQIHSFLHRAALALGMTTETTGDGSFEIRLVQSEEVISYNHRNGYSYRRGR
jgi:hypothetical protein